MTEPLTDAQKNAWRTLLETVFNGNQERPVSLIVDRRGGQRYSLAPMPDEDEEPTP